jgi:hypothetical protein
MLSFFRKKSADEKLLAAHLNADEIVRHGVKVADTAAGKEMLALPDDRKLAIVAIAIKQWLADKSVTYTRRDRLRGVVSELLRAVKDLSGEALTAIIDAAGGIRRDDMHFTSFPFKPILGVVEKLGADGPLPQELLDALRRWRTAIAPRELTPGEIREAGEANTILIQAGADYEAPGLDRALRVLERIKNLSATTAGQREAISRIDDLLKGPAATPFFVIEPTDSVGLIVASDCSPGGRTTSADWTALLRFASDLSAAKPSKKWLAEAKMLAGKIAPAELGERLTHWFGQVGQRAESVRRGAYGETIDPTLLNDSSANLLKGLAWTVAAAGRDDLAPALGTLAEACFKKVPGRGPRNSKVGNAATGALAGLGNVASAAQLSKVRTHLKHASARATVEKALGKLGEATGLSSEELEDLGVPTFDLDESGVRRTELGDCTAELRIAGRDVELRWFGPNDKPLKTVPASVKENHADALRQLKKTAKDATAMLHAQAMRIERLLTGERTWAFADWRKRFLEHPLLAAIARGLIWRIENQLVIWHDGNLVDVQNRPIEPKDAARVALWHPITSPADEVLAWRQWLESREIVQPFKQAHREIYLLTDAERQTETYSNRFAAHILKQHQLNALCQSRGWSYRLQGNFDSYNAPTLDLPQHRVTVQFICEGVDQYISDAGIYLYVSTDQVRFNRPLEQIPPALFSEIMRDVDLFVGVSSVGNDPTWRDSGPAGAFGQYWREFAFGDLSEMAKTRKATLERLLPRLKIAPRCSMVDKFLVVRGDLRTYKIHLGSGNIMMEPNDQYLCIVAAPSHVRDAGSIFLPFEGDTVLSLIISKAFLLAEDKKITDPSILAQIKS